MKSKMYKLSIFIGLIIVLLSGLIIYLNNNSTIQKNILKELEKQQLIFDNMTLLKINEKDNKTTEYIYKDSKFYYFFNLIEKENKNYDIYIYVEENDHTPIMPTYLEYTDPNSHYIYLTATNNQFFIFPKHKIILENMVSKK